MTRPRTWTSMSSQCAKPPVMASNVGASAARNASSVWSEKTTPQPNVSSGPLRSNTVTRASGRAFLNSSEKYRPAGPPPMTAISKTVKRIQPSGFWLLLLRVGVHRRAAADQIAIAERIVDAADRRPELAVLPQERQRVDGLLARVGVRPLGRADVRGGVWRVLQDVVLRIGLAVDDVLNLLADGDHRVREAIQL